MEIHASLQISLKRKGGNKIIEIIQSVVTARQDGVAMDLCYSINFLSHPPLQVAFSTWPAWAAREKKDVTFA